MKLKYNIYQLEMLLYFYEQSDNHKFIYMPSLDKQVYILNHVISSFKSLIMCKRLIFGCA